ncbi:MAG: DNA repair protein RecN [Coprothermobacterota bacterium]|nr:DNA repair protein RecN [Coprothermobacterota bacterium]
MIETLSIRNLAILEELTCQLRPGLNVFTGETGAGKSLVVDGISLLLGGRAQTDLIGRYGTLLEVDAVLQVPQENGIRQEFGQIEPTLHVSREVSAEGKNRARINGKTVPLSVLKETLTPLLHLHGQQEHEDLTSNTYQMSLLDRFSGREALALRFEAERLLATSKTLAAQRNRLEKRLSERERQMDFFRFEIQEIDRATLRPGEDQDLATEHEYLANQQHIRDLLLFLAGILRSEGNLGSLDRLEKASRDFATIASLHPNLQNLHQRLDGLNYELGDFLWDLKGFLDNLELDESRKEEVEERLDLVTRLKRKYGDTIPQVLAYREKVEASLADLEAVDRQIEMLREQQSSVREQLRDSLGQLRELRLGKAASLEQLILRGLTDLGITHPLFRIDYQALSEDELLPSGLDRIEFLFSANPGEKERPIARVASGGELSRLMLVIKAAIASHDHQSTLIFDEIDAGIGGRVGERLARMLKEVSRIHQVLCITHLPQIAAMADTHFVLQKSNELNRSVVRLEEVSGMKRIEEIARMLAGSQISRVVLAHAAEMIGGHE